MALLFTYHKLWFPSHVVIIINMQFACLSLIYRCLIYSTFICQPELYSSSRELVVDKYASELAGPQNTRNVLGLAVWINIKSSESHIPILFS